MFQYVKYVLKVTLFLALTSSGSYKFDMLKSPALNSGFHPHLSTPGRTIKFILLDTNITFDSFPRDSQQFFF